MIKKNRSRRPIKISKTIIFSLLIILPNYLYSQILNIEKSRIQEDTSKRFIGNIAANFSLNNRSPSAEAKVIFVGLTGNTGLGYFSDKNAYLFFGTINYTALTGAQPISTAYGHFRINFNRKKKLSEEVFAQIQYDESRGMIYRTLGGAGLRLKLNKTEKTEFYFGTGVMWETEEWVTPDETDSLVVKNLPKSSNYFSIKSQLNPYTSFNLINYYQVGYDRMQNIIRHRVSMDASLNFLITKHLSFNNSFSIGVEDKPVVPIQKFVYSLSNGILLKF